MTVFNQQRRVRYEGNGSARTFSFDFRIFGNEDLLVALTDSNGTESILEPGIDYQVTGAGSEEGGAVTFPITGDALATGNFITVVRNLPYVQETDILNQGAWLPEVVETALDRLTMQDLQLLEIAERSLHYPVGSEPGAVELPLPEGPSVLGYNKDGGLITYPVGEVSVDYALALKSTETGKGSGLVGWEGILDGTVTDGLGKVFATAMDLAPGNLDQKIYVGTGLTKTAIGDRITISSNAQIYAYGETETDKTVTSATPNVDLLTGVNLYTVSVGQIYLVAAQAGLTKGGTTGETIVRVLKETGTAQISFNGNYRSEREEITQSLYHTAGAKRAFHILGTMRVINNGTLTLKMNACSYGSDSTFGQSSQTSASIHVTRLI